MALAPRHLLAAACAMAALLFASPLHAACNTPAGDAGHVIFNSTHKVMQYCNGTNWVNTGAAVPAATQSGCTSPGGLPGEVIYASNLGVIQFCNGQNWVNTACAETRTPGGSGCSTPSGQPGDMQYATSANELQFCDSTNWVAMGWPCGSAGMVMLQETILSSATAGTNYTVPTGATEVRITAWGAGGAGMLYSGWSPRYVGGGGGFAEGTAAVTPGETLSLRVGQGGPTGGATTNNGAHRPTDSGASAGGGYTGVFRSTTPLLVAGAGGAGGTTTSNTPGGAGGGGGGTTGQTVTSGAVTVTGGTQSAGGTANGSNASGPGSYLASNGTNWTGGGSGYYGGASSYIGFGSGGSSYIGGLTDSNTIGATGQTAANNTHPDYIAGKGVGGNNSAGGDGLLIVRAYGPGSGGGGGGGTVTTAYASSGNGTTPLIHPVPGHTGTVKVYLAGTSSGLGNWWSPNSKGGTQGSGQTAVYTFTTTGAETSFSLTQTSSGSSSGQLSLIINGGTNNGRKLVVGSAREGNSYGAAGAANNYTANSDVPGAVLVQQGASRPHDATISYTDGTSYPVASPASYGDTTMVYYPGSYTVTMRNATSPGGMRVDSTEYGSAQSTSPEIAGTIRLGGVVMHFQ